MPKISKRQTDMTNDKAVDPNLDPQKKAKELFARRLWRLMTEKGWNQSELARRAGIGRDRVNVYIQGNALPTPENAKKLAAAFGIPVLKLYPEGEALVGAAAAHGGFAAMTTVDLPTLKFETRDNGQVYFQLNDEIPMDLALEFIAMLQARQQGAVSAA